MTSLSAPFAPDWVSPPGDSILDAIEDRGWSQAQLAVRLGCSEKHLSQLLNGKVALSIEIAQRLERVLGSTMDFWLSREAKYQQHKARIEAAARCQAWVSWVDLLPVKDLMAMGAIPKHRIDAKNKPSIVESALRFFGVASPDEWYEHYAHMQMSFRRGQTDQCDIGAISAWLRLGEQAAEKLDIPKYSHSKLRSSVDELRGLTCKPPKDFESELRRLLSNAGVTFVLVPAIPRARVSGVARWLSAAQPIVQMSLYGKTNDRFWFTFFHELAHILLHASSKDEKKSVFLDDPLGSISSDPQEVEANNWAADVLIPNSYRDEFQTLRSKASVIDFAHRVGVHPGIVAGRLQHENIIDRSWFNDLKVSFTLTTPSC